MTQPRFTKWDDRRDQALADLDVELSRYSAWQDALDTIGDPAVKELISRMPASFECDDEASDWVSEAIAIRELEDELADYVWGEIRPISKRRVRG